MSTTLKHDEKANFLLDKGMELLWSKGYNATSVNDIVKSAEIPKGSFYFYFDSKEDFAVKALNKYFDENFEILFAILRSEEPSAKKRLMNFHEFRASVLRDELGYSGGCMACNIGNEMSEHSEKIRNTIQTKQKVFIDVIAGIIREAQSAGEVDGSFDAHDMASFLEDAGKGAMISMKETNSAYPIENYLRMTKSLL